MAVTEARNRCHLPTQTADIQARIHNCVIRPTFYTNVRREARRTGCGWSAAAHGDRDTVTLSPGAHDSEPRITKQELRDSANWVDMLWEERAAAFDPFAVRVRALAEAADEVAHVVGLAELAGIRWTPRPEARFGVESLIPDAVREGPADLWHEFDPVLRRPSRRQQQRARRAYRWPLKRCAKSFTALAEALDAD